jgi:hypothetical protein
MKRWLSSVLGMLFVFGAVAPVWGNLPPPPRQAPLAKAKDAKIVLVIDERVTAPRLVIPKSLMGEKKKSAMLETPTIVAGLALTLAFVSGGVWLVRRGKARAVAAAVLAPAALTFGAATLWADIAKPPPPAPPQGVITWTLPASVSFKDEKIQIEFVDKGDDINLLVKKAWIHEEKKPEAKPESKQTDE